MTGLIGDGWLLMAERVMPSCREPDIALRR